MIRGGGGVEVAINARTRERRSMIRGEGGVEVGTQGSFANREQAHASETRRPEILKSETTVVVA
jgi:hypothetical protein